MVRLAAAMVEEAVLQVVSQEVSRVPQEAERVSQQGVELGQTWLEALMGPGLSGMLPGRKRKGKPATPQIK